MQITRGAADELSQIQTGTCTMLLDNSDGALHVRKGTPIRVRVSTGVNLMTNPSFEDGAAGWVDSSSPTHAVSATHVQHGTQAMVITWAGASGQYVTSPVMGGLTVGQQYTFSCYVWVPTGDQPVQMSLAGGDFSPMTTLTGQFERISLTWTATTTSHQVRIRSTGTPTAGDQVWVDACQLEEGAAPTEFDPDGVRIHDRFWGAVNQWPTRWQGLYATATITCSDLFATLSRQPQLRSCLDEEILLQGAAAYYPMTEPTDSVSAGDLSGTTAGPLAVAQVSVGGTIEFGKGPGAPAGGELVPLFTPVSTSVGKFLAADMGAGFAARTTTGWIHCEFWFTTSTGAGRVILAAESDDSENQLVFSLSATGVLQVEYVKDGPGSLTVVTTGSGPLTNGLQHHVVYDEAAQDIWVDGALVSFTSIPLLSRLRLLTVGGYRSTRLWSGAIDHIAWYATSGSIGAELAAHNTAGRTAFEGETADVRIARLARYGGVASVTVIGTTHDPVASQGAGGSTALSMMQEVEHTDSGRLYAERDWLGLAYQSRDVRYNPDPASEVFTISYADLDTDEVELADDDQKQVNILVAQRPGGARQRIISQPSIDVYGPYDPGETTLLKTTDAAVVAAANWIVSRYADPAPELREIPVDAYTLAQYPDILDGDISGYFTVTDLPNEAEVLFQRVTIEGYTETIKHNWHRIQFRTSRSATDSVWVLGDAVYSVLGTTTRLAY